MMADDDRIERAVYRMVEKNLNAVGENLPFSEDMFVYMSSPNANVVNIGKAVKLDTRSFVRYMYIFALGRWPEDGIEEKWLSVDKPDMERKKAIVWEILNSEEFAGRSVVVRNNVFEPRATLLTKGMHFICRVLRKGKRTVKRILNGFRES